MIFSWLTFSSSSSSCAELMLLGFISLLLTVGQGLISNICIPEKVGSTWHPCSKKEEEKINNSPSTDDDETRRKLLSISDSGGSLRRVLAGSATTDKCGEVSIRIIFPIAFISYSFKQWIVNKIFWTVVREIKRTLRGSFLGKCICIRRGRS